MGNALCVPGGCSRVRGNFACFNRYVSGRSTGWRSRRDSPRIDEVNQRLRERLRVVDELLRVRIDALVSAIGDGLFASQRRSHGTHLQQRLSWNR